MYKTQYFMMAGDYTYVFTTSNIDSEVSEVQQIILDSISVQNKDGPAEPSLDLEPAPSSDGAEQSQEGQAESGEAPEGAEQEGSVESAAQQE